MDTTNQYKTNANQMSKGRKKEREKKGEGGGFGGGTLYR